MNEPQTPPQKIRVVVDSSGDLPRELIDTFRIIVAPLQIRFHLPNGEIEEFADHTELSPSDYYEKVANVKEAWQSAGDAPPGSVVETVATGPGQWADAFRQAFNEGAEDIICVTLDADLSATHQAAHIATTELKSQGLVDDDHRVTVIDSDSISGGLIGLAIRAEGLARQGFTAQQIVKDIEARKARTEVYVVMAGNNFQSLRQGGRLNYAQNTNARRQAEAGLQSGIDVRTVLRIGGANIIEALDTTKLRRKALDFITGLVPRGAEDIFVCHSLSPEAPKVIGQLRLEHPDEEIHELILGGVAGTHGGEGALGIALVAPALVD